MKSFAPLRIMEEAERAFGLQKIKKMSTMKEVKYNGISSFLFRKRPKFSKLNDM